MFVVILGFLTRENPEYIQRAEHGVFHALAIWFLATQETTEGATQMSTTNDHADSDTSHQSAITDEDEAPERVRARDRCFESFLGYYDDASINTYPHADGDEEASFTIIRNLGNSTRVCLVECPVKGCHAPLDPKQSAATHFLHEHEPDDLGLSPITTPVAERRVVSVEDEDDPISGDPLLVDERDFAESNEDAATEQHPQETKRVAAVEGQMTLTDW